MQESHAEPVGMTSERRYLRPVLETDHDRYDVILHAEMDTHEIATGAPTTVHTVQHISSLVEMEEQQALEMVARLIHRAMRHELDECLLVDGKQAWDPHTRDTVRR